MHPTGSRLAAGAVAVRNTEKPFGRIASADAAGAAYTDQAIDQAFRAVAELAGLKVIDEWRDGS